MLESCGIAKCHATKPCMKASLAHQLRPKKPWSSLPHWGQGKTHTEKVEPIFYRTLQSQYHLFSLPVSFLPKQADLAPAYLEQCTKPDSRKLPDCKIHIPIQTLMPTPFHYLLSKYQNQRKQKTKTSSAKNHPGKPTGRKGDATTRPRKKTNTKKISHISASLCRPLFFSSHHRILKHSKTKTPSNFLKKNLKKTPEREKERKTQTQNTNKRGIAKTYETSRDRVLEIWRCRRRYDADAEVTNQMEELWRVGEGKFSKHESKKSFHNNRR